MRAPINESTLSYYIYYMPGARKPTRERGFALCVRIFFTSSHTLVLALFLFLYPLSLTFALNPLFISFSLLALSSSLSFFFILFLFHRHFFNAPAHTFCVYIYIYIYRARRLCIYIRIYTLLPPAAPREIYKRSSFSRGLILSISAATICRMLARVLKRNHLLSLGGTVTASLARIRL